MNRNLIELLAPARDLECGRVAIDHGADAVYIGAPAFGARKDAANSIHDIANLCDYAHLHGCRVHVALNTLLFDAEVKQARQLANDLYSQAHADALIVQDPALFGPDMPPIELHASTQCDNTTLEKVRFFQHLGFQQVVLARELSLTQIADIARQTTVRLEAFVHGALCVGRSGRCYMSLQAGGRSANRGECAQPCRLRYRLLDAANRQLAEGHLLSLRDNNQSNNLAALLDAGVSAFKIEGRLKGPDYVANVTLHYRQLLDTLLAERPDLGRLADNTLKPGFTPNAAKSFNRGFTDYFARGRQPGLWQPATPKALGEQIGELHPSTSKGQGLGHREQGARNRELGRSGVRLDIATSAELHNGDGLCLIPNGPASASSATVLGARIDKVLAVRGGRTTVETNLTALPSGRYLVWRNLDHDFLRILQAEHTTATVPVNVVFDYSAGVFTLAMSDAAGHRAAIEEQLPTEPARDVAAVRQRAVAALGKLGGTAFCASSVNVLQAAAAQALPLSALNALRRRAVEELTHQRCEPSAPVGRTDEPVQYPHQALDAEGNVCNDAAREFFRAHGVTAIAPGHDLARPKPGDVVMRSKHCILFELGRCRRLLNTANKEQCTFPEPLTLVSEHGRRYRLETDCKNCQMLLRLEIRD